MSPPPLLPVLLASAAACANPVVAPAATSANPVVAPAAASANPVVAPAATSANPVVAPAATSANPVVAPAATSAIPVVAPAATSAIPVVAPAAAFANPVVASQELSDRRGEPLRPVPVVLSQVGAVGDFTDGMTPVVDGRALPAQVDLLARHPDGSIRHALVSLVLPVLEDPEASELTVGFANAAPEEPGPFGFTAREAARALRAELVDADGVVWSSEVELPAPGEPFPDGARALFDGPIAKEHELHRVPADPEGRPHPGLDLFWRLREFTGEASLRVELAVEATRLEGGEPRPRWELGGLRVSHGDQELFASEPFELVDRTRFRLLVWTGEPLDQLQRQPELATLERGGFVPRYRPEGGPGRALERAEESYRVDPDLCLPLAPGVIHAHMPGTGDRPDIGPYPGWALAWLHTGAPWLYRLQLHADGNGGGSFPMHLRRAPDTAGVHFQVDRRAIEARYDLKLPHRRETRAGTEPDRAHAPSLGYLSYLVTGERFYAEEASFWASYQLAQWPWKGLSADAPERMQAWGLRHVVDAAFILPDDDPLKRYFEQAVCAYADEVLAVAERRGDALHYLRDGFRMSGRQNWVNCRRTSTWQYAWIVWSLGNAVAKGFDCAAPARDWTAEYLVGLYTNEDEYEAPDGVTYRFDPRDAMQYDFATSLWTFKPVEKRGQTQTELGQRLVDFDNYAEAWYWTKVNADNAYGDREGLRRRPDREGLWPVNDPGWGHGLRADGERAYNWHRYGAWNGMVAAVEGRVEGAREAWTKMLELAGPGSQHGFDMWPSDEALADEQLEDPATKD